MPDTIAPDAERLAVVKAMSETARLAREYLARKLAICAEEMQAEARGLGLRGLFDMEAAKTIAAVSFAMLRTTTFLEDPREILKCLED